MNKLEALTALRDKVEAGEARPHQVFNAFDTPCQDLALQQRAEDAKNAYNGSLDAAKALHKAVLPGFGWSISDCMAKVSSGDKVHAGYDEDNPARAWLLAILEALIAQEQDT